MGLTFIIALLKIHLINGWTLKSLFNKILNKNNKIVEIKYFTAKVSGRSDPKQPIRQETYLRALKAHIPEINLFFGHFLTHEIYAPLAKPEKKRNL